MVSSVYDALRDSYRGDRGRQAPARHLQYTTMPMHDAAWRPRGYQLTAEQKLMMVMNRSYLSYDSVLVNGKVAFHTKTSQQVCVNTRTRAHHSPRAHTQNFRAQTPANAARARTWHPRTPARAYTSARAQPRTTTITHARDMHADACARARAPVGVCGRI